jgi:hypothetical protein
MSRSAASLVVVLSALLLAAPAGAQVMQIERGVTVDGMVSDRFTWKDSAGQDRVAVLAHNTGQSGPGGSRGGELREFRYQTPGGTRVVRASGSAFAGFGYVVSHNNDFSFCTGGGDPSSLGHFTTGQIVRVFEGRHHAIFRFTQAYPRYCTTGAPAQQYNLPVTIDWVFSTGRDNPLWAVTWDMSTIPVGRLEDDARGPYGELLFDGAASQGGHSLIAGVGWGDRYKFVSTTNPVVYNSAWTWNAPNTIPYVKLWTSTVDATMGTVQTQTITQQDAGGYFGVNRWNTTSAGGPACLGFGEDHVMPCSFNWPYQSINYELNPLAPAAPTNGTRLAWGTNFGFLGQAAYRIHGSNYYGGPLPDTFAPGHPRKSYSTHIVLGRHTVDPVGAQVAQIETVQATALTAAIGSVATSGPAGINRPDSVAYAPAGWNHVYGAWAVAAAGNAVDANFNVTAGSLARPLVIVSNWTAGTLPSVVRLNGAPLVQDVDYFPSVRTAASELWITLGRNLAGGTNRLEIQAQGGSQLLAAAGMTVDPPSAGGNGVFETGETAVIAPAWLNTSAATQTFFGTASSFDGPPGPAYNLDDNFADFGSIAPGATGDCLASSTSNCYTMTVTGARPVQHWDATFLDTPTNGSAPALRVLHVGESFPDVVTSNPFYRFVETLLHNAVTGGCGGGLYCPSASTTREQMVVFVLVAREGTGYAPPACVAGSEMFADVPASNPFCRWVEELARRNVVSGCGGGSFCPGSVVSREQLAVFALATREPAGYVPPACVAGAEMFGDVPASNGFCRWIEELARRNVVSGCGNGDYCPGSPVTREQMGVFLTLTFGLRLY